MSEVHLHKPHPKYRQPGSWIKRLRYKSVVYGEWLLWDHTIKGIEWVLRKRGGSTEKSLVLTESGKPIGQRTAGGNRGMAIPNAWDRLTQRVRKDHPTFPTLSFNKLRKTAANLVRQFAGGEVASVFLCHGRATEDDLLDVYSNRDFRQVFAALDQVAEHLRPMFEKVPDPFAESAEGKNCHPQLGLGTIKRIQELNLQGYRVSKIAELTEVSPTTVRRYIPKKRQHAP